MEKESEELLIKELKELRVVLTKVQEYWRKQASLRWNFYRGILYGLGFFIGSAIIATGLIYLMSHLGISGESAFGRMIQKIVENFNQH
ncbi:MAG: hypothetical protein WCI57_03480 [Candidatus Berkelbacteria bacterium]